MYDDNSGLNGVHTGCNDVMSFKVTFLTLTDPAKLLMQLQKAADEITEARKQAEDRARQVDALNESVALLNRQHQDTMNLLRESGNHVEDLKQNI